MTGTHSPQKSLVFVRGLKIADCFLMGEMGEKERRRKEKRRGEERREEEKRR